METLQEIVSIEIRMPDGSYSEEQFIGNFEDGFYIPVNTTKFILPISMSEINILTSSENIRNIKIIQHQERFII